MTRKLFLALALLAITCTYSSAFDRELGIGVGLGTLGIGLEVATPVAEKLNVRGILSGATFNLSGTDSGNEYNYNLTIHALGAVADYHVFDGGFRLSGGLLINGNGIDMTAKSAAGEDYEINHVLTREMARDNPFAKRRGLQNGATESVFYLKNYYNRCLGTFHDFSVDYSPLTRNLG